MVTVLFEDNQWKAFLPLVFTRPVGEIRIGIYTIAEKWSKSLNCEVSHRTREHLRELFLDLPAHTLLPFREPFVFWLQFLLTFPLQ